VQPWEEISDTRKVVRTALMEKSAGFFAFIDSEIGRLIALGASRQSGTLTNRPDLCQRPGRIV
jgi:hypothetical protein